MSFTNYTQPDEAATAIQTFLRSAEGRAMPEDIQDKAWDFIKPGSSISFAVAYFAELIFARKSEVSAAALQLAASCAAYGQMNIVDNLGGERGAGIMQALRREADEVAPVGMSWPTVENDPDPREQFVKEEPVSVQPAPELNGSNDELVLTQPAQGQPNS